jgi:centromere protein I
LVSQELGNKINLPTYLELYQSIFRPLEEAVLDDDTLESKIALLAFYTDLVQRWALLLLSGSQPSFPADLAISALIGHASILALTIVQLSLSVSTCSMVLDFYETATSLNSHPSLRTKVRIITPPAELVYTLFFTQSLSTVSRLCAVLANYKRVFEFAIAPKATEQQSYSKVYVNHFNGFLMDLCNCLWRSRAFNTSDINALGCLLPEQLVSILTNYVSSLDTGIELPTLFSLSYSPVLCHLAIAYVRELEDAAEDEIEIRHAGPVTQASLKALQKGGGINLAWPDYRLGVLQYLEDKGAPGVGELMYNTMKHLMTARENRA